MKNLRTIFIIILLFPVAKMLSAQNKTAGIYKLVINFDGEFIEDYVANNKKSSIKGYTISIVLPDTLIESIKTFSEDLCKKKLKADVECIYKKNKKGEMVTTIGWGHVEGMPTNSYKGALASNNLDYYINISILIQTGGEPVFLGRGYYSKLEPWVIASVRVFDRGKNEVYENKVSIKDFSAIKADMIAKGGFAETYSEVLGPVELYLIIEKTLNKLIIGDK